MSIRSMLRGPSNYDDPERQQEERRAVVHELDNSRLLKRLRKRATRYAKKLSASRHVLASPAMRYLGTFVVLALMAFGVEVSIVAWTAEIMHPRMALLLRVLWAIAVGAGFTTVGHLSFTLARSPERTKWTVRRHLWFGIPGGVAAAASAFLLRSYPLLPPTMVEGLEPKMWMIAAAAGLSALVAAGSFSSLTHYFGSAKFYEWRLSKAQETLEFVQDQLAQQRAEELAATVATRERRVPAPDAAKAQEGAGNGSKVNPLKVLPVIVTLLVLRILTGCTSASPSRAVAVAAAQTHGQAPEPVTCEIDVDLTATLSPDGRRKGVRIVVEQLPDWLAEHQCTELLVGLFSGDGAWNREVVSFEVPRMPATCTDPPPGGARGAQDPPRSIAELARRDLRPPAAVSGEDGQTCAVSQADRARHRVAMLELQREVGRALVIRDDEVVATGLTDIAGVVMAQNFGGTRAALIVTDGLNTAEVPAITLRPDYHGTLIIVPTKPGHAWATPTRVHGRVAAFQAAMPGLTIVYAGPSAETSGASR